MLVDGTHHLVEGCIVNHLAKLHGLLCLALAFHLLRVELRKGFSSIWHVGIWNKDCSRMLHAIHLLGAKPILAPIILQVLNVGTISVVACGKLASHSATVAAEYHTVLAHNHWCLQSSAVVVVGNTASDILCVFVTLIVTVINSVAILVNREALIFLKFSAGIVTRCHCATLNEIICAWHPLTVGKDNLVFVALNLRGIVPLLGNGRVHSTCATLGLLLLLGKFCRLACLLIDYGLRSHLCICCLSRFRLLGFIVGL